MPRVGMPRVAARWWGPLSLPMNRSQAVRRRARVGSSVRPQRERRRRFGLTAAAMVCAIGESDAVPSRMNASVVARSGRAKWAAAQCLMAVAAAE
jgi:hypothetical protein